MTEPEPLYTLAEARQMLLDEQCATQGHQLGRADGPQRVYCPRCERYFTLSPEAKEPTQ